MSYPSSNAYRDWVKIVVSHQTPQYSRLSFTTNLKALTTTEIFVFKNQCANKKDLQNLEKREAISQDSRTRSLQQAYKS